MNTRIKTIGVLVFLCLGALVGFGNFFAADLSHQGQLTLMMVIITIGLWIFRPLNISFSLSGIFLMASFLALGIPSVDIFSGFAGTALWSLIPALFFGLVVQKTGLGRRIAYFGLKSIKVSYLSLLLMWTVVGVVLSLLTPSITVRVVIVTPIALSCVKICGLPENSKARSLVLITAWAMANIPGIGWLTGSLNGPILSGFYAPYYQTELVSFASWLKVSFLPAALITVLTLLIAYFMLKPTEKLSVPKEVFEQEYNKLGRMKREEKIVGVVLGLCLLLFMTGSLHRLPTAAICMLAMFVFGAAGIIEAKELSTGISWDLVMFVGTAMGFGAVFSATGISAWLSKILVSAIAPIAGNPWLFVLVTLALMFVWRFIDIAVFLPTMAIISAIAPEVLAAYGISPLVWLPLLCIAVNSFFLSYTNMFALVAEANLGQDGWTSAHFAKYGLAYFLASMLAMLVAIPYWIAIGLFG